MRQTPPPPRSVTPSGEPGESEEDPSADPTSVFPAGAAGAPPPWPGSEPDTSERDAHRATYASLPGSTLGLYHVGELLGEGGMGAVFAAEHTVFKRRSALKVLPADLSHEQGRVRRFLREAEALGQVRHPNIVGILNVGSADGLYFIEMERVEGGDLSTLLEEQTPFDPDRALALTMQIANGLATAHRAGIIHRDIKPGNILLTPEGAPKLADFGLAKQVDSGDDITALTADGAVIGTPRYMSPEQCRGAETDARSDIYSLGVLLFEMLTGDAPFVSDIPLTLMLRHMNQEAPAPITLRPELSRSVSNLVERMLAKDPEERFASADDVVDAIVAIAEGQELEYTARRVRHRRARRIRISLAAVVLAGVATGGWFWIQSRIAEPAVPRIAREAEAAYRGGNDAEARARLAELESLAPGDAGVAALRVRLDGIRRGWEAWNSGDPGGALAECDALLKRDDADPRATLLRTLAMALQDARAALDTRDAGAAAEAAARVIARAPDHAESIAIASIAGNMRAAEAKRAQGDHAGAVAAARLARATGRATEWADSLIEPALEHLRAAVHRALSARALLDAEQAASRLHAADPDGETSRAVRSSVERARTEFDGRYQAGLEQLGRQAGRAAHEQFALAAAIWSSDEVRARSREANVWMHRNAAQAAASQGDWVRALRAAKAALALAPDSDDVRRELRELRAQHTQHGREESDRLAAAAGRFLGAGDLARADQLAQDALALVADHAGAGAVRSEVRHRRGVPKGFVYVPTGAYPIGAADEPTNPPRTVQLAPFYVAVHEVTNAEFAEFVAAGGYGEARWWDAHAPKGRDGLTDQTGKPGPAKWRDGAPPPGTERLPVVGVSWYEADAFARWRGARLLTEAEWEVAAGHDPTAAVARSFPWGAAWSPDRVGFDAGMAPALAAAGTRTGDLSGFGCFDMAGNVMEWTSSRWEPGSDDRVVRGGSLHPIAVDILDPQDGCRVARRHAGADPLAARLPAVGFRIARETEGE